MRISPQTLFLLAVFGLGAMLANLAEERLRSSDPGTPGESHATLARADVREFLGGDLRYRVEAEEMLFREDGSVLMDAISGDFPQEGGTVTFSARSARATSRGGALSLSGAVRMVMPDRHRSVVAAPAIDLLVDGGGIAGDDGVTIDVGTRARIVARTVRWAPGSPMELEDVSMVTAP